MKIYAPILFVLLVTSFVFSQSPCPNSPTVTYAGKTYNTVQIGTQCWLKENLEVGIMILGNKNPGNNNSVEKYYYNNDSINLKNFGAYYQWNEAMQYKTVSGAQGICPPGWHIPTLKELQTLADYVQNNGNSLKVSGSGTGGGIGTNSSGFSAFLSGYRGNDGYFSFLNSHVRFWSSDTVNTNEANILHLYPNLGNIGFGSGDKEFGYCIRCIKDNFVSAVSKDLVPDKFSLTQNYPNPFNPETTIKYTIPSGVKGETINVTLKVYDVLGSEVATLVNEKQKAGAYNYQFSIINSQLTSGVYFYQLRAGNFVETKKFILMK